MLKNYFLLTLRNLRKNKLYAFISIFGLALGMSCTTLIALYVTHELSYDRFHEKKDRLYRVTATIKNTDIISTGSTSAAVGPALQQEFPEVESYCRVIKGPQYNTIFYQDKSFEETKVFYVDSTFFHLFSYRLLEGNPATALEKPFSMVISKSMSEKYFGNGPALGKTLRTVNNVYTVTGVVEDCPTNSDLQYNALISMSSFPAPVMENFLQDWFYITSMTYVLLNENTAGNDFRSRLPVITEKYVKPWSEVNGGIGTVDYDLQRIDEVHLDNSKKFDTPKGNRQYIYIFGMVGIFILVIACINYVNLALSQSFRRAREVGIRKTLGADRGQLIFQFIGESLVIAFISLFIGLVLVELLLPFFNGLAQKSFSPYSIFRTDLLLYYSGVILGVGLLSGSYPAFVLSSFQPVTVLKGILPRFGSSGYLRKALVVLQFVFSVLMILGTIVVFNQMSYMKGRDLGFNKEEVLVIQVPGDTSVINKMDYARQEMLNLPEVSQVSLNGGLPGYPLGELLFRIEQPEGMQERGIKFMPVDENFISVMGLELKAGRNLDPKKFPSDSLGGFIINETAARTFGWEEPIGKRLQWGLLNNDSASNDGKVIGVVKDFHFASLHNPIEPLVMFCHTWGGGLLTLKLQTDDVQGALKKVEDTWRRIDKIHNFKYSFLDDTIGALYRNEERMLKIFGYFALISIFISALGLFALTSYATERRTREIGIRKVMGASVFTIGRLIGKEFIILVLTGFVIAIPIGYYFLSKWLTGFAYHVSLHPWFFILSAMIVLVIAAVAMSYNALKAANSDPVKALKYE